MSASIWSKSAQRMCRSDIASADCLERGYLARPGNTRELRVAVRRADRRTRRRPPFGPGHASMRSSFTLFSPARMLAM